MIYRAAAVSAPAARSVAAYRYRSDVERLRWLFTAAFTTPFGSTCPVVLLFCFLPVTYPMVLPAVLGVPARHTTCRLCRAGPRYLPAVPLQRLRAHTALLRFLLITAFWSVLNVSVTFPTFVWFWFSLTGATFPAVCRLAACCWRSPTLPATFASLFLYLFACARRPRSGLRCLRNTTPRLVPSYLVERVIRWDG